MFTNALESERIGWIVAGNDAENDFYGNYHGINLAYARKTGLTNPGSIQSGARVFQVSNVNSQFKVDTWIRNKDGSVDSQTDNAHKPPLLDLTI